MINGRSRPHSEGSGLPLHNAVVVVIVVVQSHASHMPGHRNRICLPARLCSEQALKMNGSLYPHSLGSGIPLHSAVVVVAVIVVVVVVVVVEVVDATHESQPCGHSC